MGGGGSWNFSYNANNLVVGYYNTGYYRCGVGLTFSNVAIPQGATITSAYLQLDARGNDSAIGVNSYISAENVDNSTNGWSTETDFESRYANRTAGNVTWDNIGSWVAGTWYTSPDISSVVQTIVNRPGWVSGNNLSLFWEDFSNQSAQTNSTMRRPVSYEGGASKAAILVVNYTN